MPTIEPSHSTDLLHVYLFPIRLDALANRFADEERLVFVLPGRPGRFAVEDAAAEVLYFVEVAGLPFAVIVLDRVAPGAAFVSDANHIVDGDKSALVANQFHLGDDVRRRRGHVDKPDRTGCELGGHHIRNGSVFTFATGTGEADDFTRHVPRPIDGMNRLDKHVSPIKRRRPARLPRPRNKVFALTENQLAEFFGSEHAFCHLAGRSVGQHMAHLSVTV